MATWHSMDPGNREPLTAEWVIQGRKYWQPCIGELREWRTWFLDSPASAWAEERGAGDKPKLYRSREKALRKARHWLQHWRREFYADTGNRQP